MRQPEILDTGRRNARSAVPTTGPSSQTGSGRYVWLSSLRAFGVVLVLLYHFFPKLCPGGFIGVDVFFVFSGFLITSLLVREFGSKGRIGLGSFYKRRLKRLLPAVLATLLVTLPLSMLISEDFRVSIAEQVAAVLGWVTNFYEIANGQSYASQLLPHLYVHTWTLSIEMQFYLLWGAVLAVAIPALSLVSRDGRVSTAHARKIICIVSLVGAALSWGLMQVFLIDAGDPSGSYFNTLSHLFPLLIGSAVGLVAGFPKTSLTQAVGRLSPVLAIVICVLALGGITAIAFFASFEGAFVWRFGLLATSLLTALVIIIGRGMQSRLRNYRENPVINWLADRSYSIYLFHWPLFIIIDHMGIPAPASTVLVPLLALATTFIASELCYRFVEQPFTSGGVRAAADTAATTATGETGRRVSAGGGLASRVVMVVLALICLLTGARAIASAPALNTVTADNRLQALQMDINQAEGVNALFALSTPDPVVGLGTDVGLPPPPSYVPPEDIPTNEANPSEAALLNMHTRQSGGSIAPGSITVIGDSVTLGAASVVEDVTGAYVDAAGYRKMQEAAPLVANLQTSGALGEYVVIACATNIFENSPSKVDEIIAGLGPGRHLIFVTAYGIDLSFYGLDAYLRELPSRYPFVSIADWTARAQTVSSDHFTSDGIHCNDEVAKQAYAHCILDAINAARDLPRK